MAIEVVNEAGTNRQSQGVEVVESMVVAWRKRHVAMQVVTEAGINHWHRGGEVVESMVVA